MDSDDLAGRIPSLGRMFQFYKSMTNLRDFHTCLYVHEQVAPLRQRMENPLDMALAVICDRASNVHCEKDTELTTAYVQLVSCVDKLSTVVLPVASILFLLRMISSGSIQESVCHDALRYIKIALSVNRYARRDILSALSSSDFCREETYNMLVEETKSTCVPKDCSKKGTHNSNSCKEHQPHHLSLHRHCDEKGKLIHIQVRLFFSFCNAEVQFAIHSHPVVSATENAEHPRNMKWYTTARTLPLFICIGRPSLSKTISHFSRDTH